MSNATLCKINGTTCKGNSVDGTKAAYRSRSTSLATALYPQGNKIDFGSNGGVWSIADRYGNRWQYNYERSENQRHPGPYFHASHRPSNGFMR